MIGNEPVGDALEEVLHELLRDAGVVDDDIAINLVYRQLADLGQVFCCLLQLLRAKTQASEARETNDVDSVENWTNSSYPLKTAPPLLATKSDRWIISTCWRNSNSVFSGPSGR